MMAKHAGFQSSMRILSFPKSQTSADETRGLLFQSSMRILSFPKVLRVRPSERVPEVSILNEDS